jgi:transcription initiation factor TFIID subunit 7
MKVTFKNVVDGADSPATPTAPATPISPAASKSKRVSKKSAKAAAAEAASLEEDDEVPLAAKKASKKRPRNDKDDETKSPAAKRPAKPKGVKDNGAPKLKLSMSKVATMSQAPIPLSTPKIKLKNKSQLVRIKTKNTGPPPRAVGVGYDSEAEDVELDPIQENQFILRMQPGDDCEYLRTAIADRKIGLPRSEGGADITFKFYDKDARRSMITIRGKSYAAMMVDLPCIVEAHKSWDKRSFYKVADIHQMLLVLGPVKNDEEAKNYPMPADVDPLNFQFAHGITPPMHYVRKRRFRKRVSHRTIEAVEEEVNRLMALERETIESGGKVETLLLNPDEYRERDEDTPTGYDEDGEGEDVQDSIEVDAEGEVDDDLERMMMEAFEAGGDEDPMDAVTASLITNAPLQGSPEAILPTTAISATPGTQTSLQDDADESSDEDDDEEELDEDEIERRRERQQHLEEIEDIRKELRENEDQLKKTNNIQLQKKINQRIENMKKELKLKLANIGEGDEDEDE